MWLEWLARRCDMGAFAAVSSIHPPSSVDQLSSENITPLSTLSIASLWSMQKAERRARAPHIFPLVLPLSGSSIVTNEVVLSPVSSPCFDYRPCKDLGNAEISGSQKAMSILSLEEASGEGTQMEVESISQVAKNHLQTIHELKQLRFNHRYETPLELEKYKNLKARFWKHLVVDSFKDRLCDSTEIGVTKAPKTLFGNNIESSNATKIKEIASLSKGCGKKRIGLGLNGPVEKEVVLLGGKNALPSKETIMVPNSNLIVAQIQQDEWSHLQNVAYRDDNQDILDCQHVILCQRGKSDQSSLMEKDCEDDSHSTNASSKEESDRKSLEGSKTSRLEGNLVQQQFQELGGSECNFSSRGGIGRGHMREDKSPTSTSSNCQTCEDVEATIGNLKYNMKEKDETFWSKANWCVVDSYMTSHGKETTWTIRGFEEDDGLFERNLTNCKDGSALKLFATKESHSHLCDFPTTQFFPIDALGNKTQHVPSPKWAQQEQIAKNLQAQQKNVRSSKNGFGIVKSHVDKKNEGNMEIDDGGKEDTQCPQFALDEVKSNGNILHGRKERKLLKECILKHVGDKVGGGSLEESIYMYDIESTKIQNLIKNQEFRRRKRGWAIRKVMSLVASAECGISTIGGGANALWKTREDASSLALETAIELQAIEMKNLKATSFAMFIHIDLLWSEIEGLERERGFNTLMVFPWKQFFINIIIGISLVSGTSILHRAIKSLFQLLFGGIVQSATSRKEKTIVAMTILCSSSYIGKEMWQIFGQMQAKKKRNEDVFQEKLHLVLERLSKMSKLIYKASIEGQFQARETNKIPQQFYH